ncbi:hypothetical protein C3486_26925 [Streptomyces sp. Ru73]|uniref:ANTAR domain-containing protein n=1 Tax=Streptomyces sp. Ru73 TaxID=2080748 RepID=UPI000CDDFE53|nr:ANTAR domain-containing protein [Streptomyces sp. Ru73]POX37726.1 hypothetical protein C3486_26925 [Streptomyces sp. Ru73]
MVERDRVEDPALAACLDKLAAGLLPLRECARALGLDGLALLLAYDAGTPEPVRTHGPLTVPLEDLQLVYGQGPSVDAAQHGITVLVPDLAAASSLWTGLTPPLQSLGVEALFAFPINIGNTRLGAFSGHRRAPGGMTSQQLNGARLLADAAAHTVLRLTAWLTAENHLPFVEAHQASGVLALRHGISLDQAWLRLRMHAFRHDRSLLETSRALLHDGFDFDDTPWP